MKRTLTLTLLVGLILCIAKLTGGCAKSSSVSSKEDAEKKWGSERVCLPCHLYQQPIARAHHYRCDTCHRGNPWAEDKAEGHLDLIHKPQLPENIGLTCDKCHRRVLGRDVPYTEEFIRDVLVSHKPAKEATTWQE